MTNTQEELTEGYYFCPRCNRKTIHELHPQVPPHYETASEEEIAELEKDCILTCISCADREEAAYRDEVYDEVNVDPYSYITLALDQDEEDDSGLSGEFEEDDDDGLPDPSDYEEDDHYVETFRDRRLDQ